jgi:hypothetical protein
LANSDKRILHFDTRRNKFPKGKHPYYFPTGGNPIILNEIGEAGNLKKIYFRHLHPMEKADL